MNAAALPKHPVDVVNHDADDVEYAEAIAFLSERLKSLWIPGMETRARRKDVIDLANLMREAA